MKRSIAALAVAFGCSCVIAVSAQETKTTVETKTEGGKATTVSYTGCMQTGTETRSVVLAKVQPVSRTTETAAGTGGATTTTTTTTYALVPGEKVEFQTHVGHKVEVTGMMIPAGESKTTTETKIEREDAPDTKAKETVKTNNPLPQFRVMSIKDTNEACE
jgi:predicted extracellular nuclease